MADESELEELDLYADTEAAKVTVDRQQRLHPQPLTSSDIEPRMIPTRPSVKPPSSKLLWVLLFLNLLMLLFSGGAFLVIVGVDNAVSQMLIQQQQLLNLTKS